MKRRIQVHLENISRQYESLMNVMRVYYRPEHILRQWRQPKTFDFYYIMEGTGVCIMDGREYQIKPNTAVVLTSGIRVEQYTNGEWLAMTVVYNVQYIDYLRKTPFWPTELAWEVKNRARARHLTETIVDYCENVETPGNADMIDSLCYALLIECMRKSTPGTKKADIIIDKIVHHIENNFLEDINFDELARKHGISRSHFFRRWKEHVNMKPVEYVHYLKMRKAVDLLLQTDLRINEIADELNYEDPFYFTYKFKKIMGVSPREYRKA